MADPLPAAKPRPATPAEISLWERFKRYYERELTPSVFKAKTTAEIAADAQLVIDRLGVPGFIFDSRSYDNVQLLLNRYNLLGRLITAVESGKYFIRIKDGDIDVLASSEMAEGEYAPDIWPPGPGQTGLGAIPVIIWVLVVGVTLVGGLWASSAIIDSIAKKQQAENKKALIDADKEIAKLAPDVRRSWADFKRANQPKAQKAGILGEIFGTEAASTLATALGVGLLALAALYAFRRKGS